MNIFGTRKWQNLFATSRNRIVVLLLFVSRSSAASAPPISNEINEKYKTYTSDYHQINHQGYGYPSAYHGYSPGSGLIGQKQDLDSSSGGLGTILSSLTSSFSGNGEQSTGTTDDEGSSSALSILGSAGSGLGSLGGVALGGAKGLLGLKGVTAFGLGFTLLFFMVMGPVIAAGIAVPIVAIVYASIYIPAIGLMNEDDVGELVLVNTFNDKMNRNGRALVARSVHDAQLCVERISCEIGRIGRGHGFGKLIQWAADKSEMKTDIKALKRVARAAKLSENCTKYTCDPVRSIARLFK